MRSLALAALLVATAFAGCSQPPTGTSSSIQATPGPPGTDADLWVVLSFGCGFCSGSPDIPEFQLVALHRDGLVVAVDYALASGLGPSDPVVVRAGLEPFEDMVVDVFSAARLYAIFREEAGVKDPAHVLGVATAQMDDGDFQALRAQLEDALEDPGAPGSTEYGVTDCGAAVIEAFGSPLEGRVQHGCGIEAAPGWRAVADELRALDPWVRARGDIALPTEGVAIVPALAPVHRDSGNPRPGSGDDGHDVIVAALHMRACGGLMPGCSGASGLVLYADGRAQAFWGTPWGPGEKGRTQCLPGDPLRHLADDLGEGWEVPCAEEYDLRQGRGGAVPLGAWANISARLEEMTLPEIPAVMQEEGCCDRVFTQVRFHLRGESDFIVVEGTDVDAGVPPVPLVPLVPQLLALQQWLGPSAGGPWAIA